MTRVEGENCRLRHYLARLQTLLTSLPLRYRKTRVLFQIDRDVESLSKIIDLLSCLSPDSSFDLNHSHLGNAHL
jgi:hypothetical protein